jgi:hypothetical protein
MKALAVTGYVTNAFPAKPLSPDQFLGLGDRFKNF